MNTDEENYLNIFPNIPDNMKKYVLDEKGNPSDSVKKFMTFFDLLHDVFEAHFIGMISKLSPSESWDILRDPSPFINQVCLSFSEEYEKEIVSKMGDVAKKFLDYYFPKGYISLLHKKHIIAAIMTLPNGILSLGPEIMAKYYRVFSEEDYLDDEGALSKLLDIIRDFSDKVAVINNKLQCEWQDHILDAYNKNIVTKEMMEFIMAQINKRKVDVKCRSK